MMINTAILPQDKRDLAIASQTYLSELKDKVSELDIHLVNSGQINIGQQIDAIIGISRSLKEIVSNKQIESDYPIFTTIHQHFDAIAHKLRRCIEIDWITKGLLLEVINLMERMINEYCLENQTTNTDWESLQRELFEQLDQHLSKSIDESTFLLTIETDDRENQNQDNVANDPFNLDNTLEALHLFDLDQDSSDEDDLTTLFPSIIGDFNEINEIDELENPVAEVIPMPEILADIFLGSGAKMAGSEDETELQGVNWENIDHDIEIDFDNHEDDPLLNDAWHQFNVLDAWSSHDEIEDSILDELEASFDVANDQLAEELNELEIDLEMDDFVQNSDHQNLDHQNLVAFDTPDIDTAIEESPIYQKHQNPQNHNFDYDKSLQAIDHDKHYHDTLANVGSPKDSPMRWAVNSLATSHDLNIKIPYGYLEKLGDLSEDLVIRKGTIAAYLNGMRTLSSEINNNLALLDEQSFSQNNDSESELDRKNQEVAIADVVGSLKKSFDSLLETLNRTEQQTEVMNSDIRYLRQHLYQTLKCPISSLMGKFPRILHDLSLQYGKQVELVVQGADIGVERVIAESLAEPLDLLLRHSLKYGIELPAERQQQGKPPQGRIEVIASQTDEVVEIKISDDGRSIDRLLPDNLITLCDDVQQRLHTIGGSITVKPSGGSQFTLTLPNTLSLIRVVLITINRMCLAIPSKSILEVLPISTANGRSLHMLEWRDRCIPIVKLSEVLMLNCRPIQGQAAGWRAGTAGQTNDETISMPAFLVMESEGELGALEVDSCWGDQDATFHLIEGDIALPQLFSGAVILGTNQAVTLLNPWEVLQRSQGQAATIANSNDSYPSSPTEQLELSPKSNHVNAINSINSLSDFFSNDNQSPPSRQPLLQRQIRVLIVESSANVRRYLAMTLSKCGFLTEQAQDSQKAIALVKAKQQAKQQGGIDIDVVITDLEMPQMDGFKLLSSMQADPDLQNLPIVVLTSHNNENDQKLALELGAKAFFSKPYREQELVETLKKLVI